MITDMEFSIFDLCLVYLLRLFVELRGPIGFVLELNAVDDMPFRTRACKEKRISEKRTKNQAKTDQTEHGMVKRGKDKVKSKPKSTKVKVKSTLEKSTVKTGVDT
ncbi:hypothetical protein Tco_0129638 [Tanacetum coccineum]